MLPAEVVDRDPGFAVAQEPDDLLFRMALLHTSDLPQVKTLIECCAAGQPMVATDVGGTSKIVRHGENGLLVPSGDVAAMAAAIDEVLTDPARAAAMGRAGRRTFKAEFTLETMSERYCALFRDMAAQMNLARGRPSPKGM